MTSFLDNLRLSLGTFVSNPLRSLLTLLGIVIGVTTVIAMMALIEGLRIKVNRDLSQLGANTFQVQKMPIGFGRFNWQKFAKRPSFSLADRDAIRAACPTASAVTAKDSIDGQKITTTQRETRANVLVWSATDDYLETNALTVGAGRSFSELEVLDARRVALLGMDVADVLFPGEDPINQQIRLRGRNFRVIGVFQRRGSFLGLGSQDNLVVIPVTAFAPIYGKSNFRFSIATNDPGDLSKAQDEVITLLRRRRNLAADAENNFEVFTNDTLTKTFNGLSQVITVATFGVCLLSLIVGGIGILNIMLVAVTERTREIGIRKALGAKRKRILAQFTTEAVVLSLVGGLIGIVFGFLVAFLGRWVLDFPTQVPAWAVLLSLAMSSGVGLVFGIYPAARASRLDPVEAMRAE
jgi:putative ABC transport system permease protein